MPRSKLIAVAGVMLATSLDPGLASPGRAQQTSLAPDVAGAPMPKPLPFPDAIHVKTPRRTFNLFFYFALDDQGRIWVKSIPGASPDTEKIAPDWQLFLGSGLPHDRSRKGFAAPRRIESINADQDELMAVSDGHRHYSLRWFENPVFKEETPAKTWADQHGWPVSAPLVWDARVEGNRGWAVGRRTRNFVMFEDAAGRTFDGGGGLSTYYILMRDGRSIAFSDSGLPADFSHTIDGPERSTFIAESIQVAADTILLINAYGEIVTRMIDFDTNGSDTMFFVYTYDRKDPRPDAIALPPEDWFAHKPIPLEGQAQISTRIAIALTGKHNRDRELRVAGFDRERRAGYFYKRIFDQADGSPLREDRDEWRFKVDPTTPIEADRLLDPADTDPDPTRASRRTAVPTPRWQSGPRPARRAPRRELAFSGELRVAGKPSEIVARVPAFQLDSSPTQLIFSAGADSIEVTLHTVERWYHLPRFDPGRDGTPKEFQVTLQIPPAAAATTNPALRALLDQVLAPYHLAAFALSANATEDYLEIATNSARSGRGKGPAIALHLGREGRAYPSLAVARREALRRDALVPRARDASLQIDRPLGKLTGADIPLLRAKIGQNLQAANQLVRDASAPERQDAATPGWLSPAVLGGLRFAARPWMIKALMPALPFRNVSTKEAAYYAKNLATNMPPLLMRSRALKDLLLLHAREDLERALIVIDTRIAAYRTRLDELRGARPARAFVYFESLEGYWEPFRFGQRAATVITPAFSGVTAGCQLWVSDQAIFDPAQRALYARRPAPAGLRIQARCPPGTPAGGTDDATLGLRVSAPRLERDFFRASARRSEPVGSPANPLATPVRVQLEHAARSPQARRLLTAIFNTKALAEAQELPAELSIRDGRFRISAPSLTLEWRR